MDGSLAELRARNESHLRKSGSSRFGELLSMIQSDRRKTHPDVSVGSYAAKGGVNVMMLVIALKVTVVLWGKEGGGCRTDSSSHHPDNSESASAHAPILLNCIIWTGYFRDI